MIKLCPNHGPIDWPRECHECPACGEELRFYENAVDAAFAIVTRTEGPAAARDLFDHLPPSRFHAAARTPLPPWAVEVRCGAD